MKNSVQQGASLAIIATEDMVSGKAYVVGNIRGVAAYSALTGEECHLVTEEAFELTKTVADVITQGAKVNLNPTSGEITIAATAGNFPFGLAIEAAGNGDTTCKVKVVNNLSAAL